MVKIIVEPIDCDVSSDVEADTEILRSVLQGFFCTVDAEFDGTGYNIDNARIIVHVSPDFSRDTQSAIIAAGYEITGIL